MHARTRTHTHTHTCEVHTVMFMEIRPKNAVDWTKLTGIISQYWRYLNTVMDSWVI